MMNAHVVAGKSTKIAVEDNKTPKKPNKYGLFSFPENVGI